MYLPDGRVLGTPRPSTPSVELARSGRTFFVDDDEGQSLYAAVPDRVGGPMVVRYTTPQAEISRDVLVARLVLAGLGALLLAVSVAVTWWLARSFLVPIQALAETAERLGAGDLEARVEPAGPPEIRDVGAALNRLAGRVGELLAGEREHVADLAHRLRTPVTALRLDAEGLADPVERERLGDDADRLARMVDEVIREARRPVREGVGAGCDAVAVVGERVEFWRVLAEDQGRRCDVVLPTRACPVRIDAADLADALDALLGNVFHHTDEGAAVAVSVVPGTGGGAAVTVEDSGPGLPDDSVVERGASGAGSTGLGLDIARRTAEASRGRLVTGRSTRLGGASVTMVLGAPGAG